EKWPAAPAQRQSFEMAKSLTVMPLPAPTTLRTFSKELPGQRDVVLSPLSVGPADAVDVELPLLRLVGGHEVSRAGGREVAMFVGDLQVPDCLPALTLDQGRGDCHAGERQYEKQPRRYDDTAMSQRPFRDPFDETWTPGPDRLVLQEPPEVVGQLLRRLEAAGRLL